VSISLKQVVALKSVCMVAGVARSSVYWSRQTLNNPAPAPRAARGPVGAYSDAVPVKGFLDTRLQLMNSIMPPFSRLPRNSHGAAGQVA
jgi:hypothetical protein